MQLPMANKTWGSVDIPICSLAGISEVHVLFRSNWQWLWCIGHTHLAVAWQNNRLQSGVYQGLQLDGQHAIRALVQLQ